VTAQFTALTFNGLASIVTGLVRGDTQAATEQVSGVVGVGYVFDSASFLGPVFMLMIVAVISLSLAIMNSLPIPALDGGRLFVTLLFRVLKKPLTKDLEEKIHGTGFALLMVLFVLITIVDVQRFIL
jgi:regulator of sigma E protease